MSRRLKQWFFITFLAAALFAWTGLVLADTEIQVAMPASSEYSTRKNSEDFTITMEEEDVIPGYHHGPVEGSTEIYAKMTFRGRSEIWLSISLPMITKGDAFSRISYDLLLADKKTVVCSYTRSPGAYRMTEINLFRGILPAGTYYLRLHHFYDGDCPRSLTTHLTTDWLCDRSYFSEDDLAGSNNTREKAASFTDRITGYLSYLGDDPQDWYSFSVGKGGGVLTGERIGEGALSYELLRQDGTVVQERTTLWDSLTESPESISLAEGSYYLCVHFEELKNEEERILNRRGGAYYFSLKQNEPEATSSAGTEKKPESTSSGSTEKKPETSAVQPDNGGNKDSGSAGKTGGVTVGTVRTVSGQTFTVTKTAGSGGKGAVTFKTAANKKTVTVPASIKLDGNTYLVTAVAGNAFKGSRIRTVTIGKNVARIGRKAFNGSRAAKVILKTRKLTKASVSQCLKGSKVATVTVKTGNKKINAADIKKYKKIFTKKNAGKKVAVR